MAKQVVALVGGSGKVALHFTRLASSKYDIKSFVRSEQHFDAIRSNGGDPRLLSIEEASVEQIRDAISGADAVVFSAGAGGKGGQSRTEAVDFEAAVKTFDAIERLQGGKVPRLLLVSAWDVRDLNGPVPKHYDERDKERSKQSREAIGFYYEQKLKADQDLVKRTAFEWTILRPGRLSDDPGSGQVDLGITHAGQVSREDVGAVLLALLEEPKSAGLALDLMQGQTPIKEAVEKAVQNRTSAFP